MHPVWCEGLLLPILLYIGFTLNTIARKRPDFHASRRNFLAAAHADPVFALFNLLQGNVYVVDATTLGFREVEQHVAAVSHRRHVADVRHAVLAYFPASFVGIADFIKQVPALFKQLFLDLGKPFTHAVLLLGV
jgi:hypothetical protein